MALIQVKNREIKDYFPTIKARNLTKTLLYNLGLTELEAKKFLNAKEESFEDPFKIYGIKKAAKIINKYIKERKKIVIHGDFDVDGVCASTILWDYLYFVRKADAYPIIPNRVDEGYGLSEKTIQKAIDMNANLIITVDCGIKDKEIIDKFKDKIDFIITDHHQFLIDENGNVVLPEAKAVVHPLHPKSRFSSMISGAAVTWQLVRALEELKEDEEKVSTEDYLDLVAISTICDIIPLTLENRKFVLKGFDKIKENKRVGLEELLKITQINPQHINSYHFGFILGPRLNAPGRILNDAMPSMRLLSTRNIKQAQQLALELNNLNLKRQTLTQEFLIKAEKQINGDKKAIVIMGEEWPEGILGLIAGKLAEKYFRPVFVASVNDKDEIIGSARSPLENFYLNDALEYTKKHLTRFGGHKQAAGFASKKNIFAGFEEHILDFIQKNTKDDDFVKKIFVDIEITDLDTINIADIEEINLLEPFGIGNPKPTFLLSNCTIQNIQEFGKNFTHIKLDVYHNKKYIIAKAFNKAEQFKNLRIGQNMNLLGHFSINDWNNTKSIEFIIIDMF